MSRLVTGQSTQYPTTNQQTQKGSTVEQIQDTKPYQFRVPPSDIEVELAYTLNDLVDTREVCASEKFRANANLTMLQQFKALVRDHVIETALDKEWCVDGTNRHLSAVGLDEWGGPTKDYEVTYTVVYTHTATVEDCASEDEAARRAEDMFESSDLRYETPDDFSIDEIRGS